MTDISFTISTKALAQLVKPVIPMAHKDGMLPILNAVRFQAAGKYLVASATDRFRIGVARVVMDDAPPADLDFIVGLDDLKQMLSIFKSTATVERHVIATVLEDRIKVEQSGGFGFIEASMSFRRVQGDYPRVIKIIAEADLSQPVQQVGVNASYLADFRHATRHGEPLVVRSAPEGKPLIVTSGEDFIGAIMPVRASSDETGAFDSWRTTLSDVTSAIAPAKKATAKSKKAVA